MSSTPVLSSIYLICLDALDSKDHYKIPHSLVSRHSFLLPHDCNLLLSFIWFPPDGGESGVAILKQEESGSKVWRWPPSQSIHHFGLIYVSYHACVLGYPVPLSHYQLLTIKYPRFWEWVVKIDIFLNRVCKGYRDNLALSQSLFYCCEESPWPRHLL